MKRHNEEALRNAVFVAAIFAVIVFWLVVV